MRFEDAVALKHHLLPYIKKGKHPIFKGHTKEYGFHYGFHISGQWIIDEDEIMKIIDSYYT